MSSASNIRIAILFQRFGPYHHARLNAAGRILSVWGLEACAMEDIYAWDKVEGAAAFTRVTLTDRNSSARQWKRELHQKIHQALGRIKPQVVAVPGWSSPEALSAILWCLKTKTPMVVMSESVVWDEARVNWKEWIKGRLVKLCVAGLAGGRPHADYLVQLGIKRDQIFQGYDVVDNEYFSAQAREIRIQKTEIRNKFGLPEKYFLASARFVEKKNLLRLIEAYAQYRLLAGKKENGKHGAEVWSLVLLGDGPLKPEIHRLISELHLENHVFLPGFKQYEELPAYFALAEVFIHASKTEQWGLVVNEAMASGLPVLVSNRCGCAADLVSEGVNGFTFDPFDVGKIAELMSKISTSNFPLSTFGRESQRLISSWGPERFATGLKAAAKFAVEHSPKRAGWLDRFLLNILLRR
jgi:1,2-diacylglycerol 3-alpha-glucosyltransferase